MASSLPLSLSPGLASTLGLIAEGTRRTGAQGAAGSPVGATRKGKVVLCGALQGWADAESCHNEIT